MLFLQVCVLLFVVSAASGFPPCAFLLRGADSSIWVLVDRKSETMVTVPSPQHISRVDYGALTFRPYFDDVEVQFFEQSEDPKAQKVAAVFCFEEVQPADAPSPLEAGVNEWVKVGAQDDLIFLRYPDPTHVCLPSSLEEIRLSGLLEVITGEPQAKRPFLPFDMRVDEWLGKNLTAAEHQLPVARLASDGSKVPEKRSVLHYSDAELLDLDEFLVQHWQFTEAPSRIVVSKANLLDYREPEKLKIGDDAGVDLSRMIQDKNGEPCKPGTYIYRATKIFQYSYDDYDISISTRWPDPSGNVAAYAVVYELQLASTSNWLVVGLVALAVGGLVGGSVVVYRMFYRKKTSSVTV